MAKLNFQNFDFLYETKYFFSFVYQTENKISLRYLDIFCLWFMNLFMASIFH